MMRRKMRMKEGDKGDKGEELSWNVNANADAETIKTLKMDIMEV